MNPVMASVEQLLCDLRSGNAVDASAQGLWSHFANRLLCIAAHALRGYSYSLDEEDIVSIVFALFCQQIRTGRLASIDSEESAGRMLAIMVAQKVATLIERERRQKRGGGRVVTESALGSRLPDGFNLDHFPEPIHSCVSETLPLWLLDRLQDLGASSHQLIVLRKFEGYTNEEISQELGCGLRTVERHLQEIRKHLAHSNQDH